MLRDIGGELIDRGVGKGRDFLGAFVLEGDDRMLAAQPSEQDSAVLATIAEDHVGRKRPLGGAGPLVPNFFQLAHASWALS